MTPSMPSPSAARVLGRELAVHEQRKVDLSGQRCRASFLLK
jgi:hypothetical protein